MLEAHTIPCPNGLTCRFGFQNQNIKYCNACQSCGSTELYDVERHYIEGAFWRDKEE